MRIFGIGILICALAIPGAASSADFHLPGPKERWIEVQSANFVFFSNAGVGTTKRVAVDLEELRAVLAELGNFKPNSPVPTFIFVFRNDRSFDPYKHRYEGGPATISGFFLGRDNANYIAINADSPDASGTVFHEYVHHVTANNMWWLPVWLSEGLAEFYQTFEVVSGIAYIGLPIRNHLIRIGGRTLVPYSTLLSVDHDSPYYNERDRKGDFYAQSWALTHYLLLGSEERREQLNRYLELMGDGAPELEAFSTAFGADYKTLEQEVVAHLRSPRFPILAEKTETDVDDRLVINEMQYADVLYRLGDLLANERPTRPEADRYFAAALQADPEHSPSLAAIALQAEMRADWDGARKAYERALRSTPPDPEILFRWGEFLRARGTDTDEALAALKKSTELDPSFGPAWVALATVYADLGDSSPEAVAAAETANRLEPSNPKTTQNLLRLYLRLDERQRAVWLIEGSLRSNRVLLAQAWSTILMKDLQRARESLLEEDLMAARERTALVERDIGRSSRPDSIRRNLASIQKTIAEHEGARLYDQAVVLLDAGRPEEARSVLEEALANIDESAVARSCLHLIDVIDNPEKYEPEEPAAAGLSPTPEEISKLNQLLAARELDAAHSYLLELCTRSAGGQKRWLEDKIREIERTRNYNRYVDGYNTAVDLYNEGDFRGAIDVLEKLLTVVTSGYQADSARALLADARAALEKD